MERNMPNQPDKETNRKPSSSSSSSFTSTSTTKKPPNRKFFHNVEPIFSIAQPKTQQLQFLDNSDPGKSAVVRKKAREWVHWNKQHELAVKTKKTEKKSHCDEVEFEIKGGGKGSVLQILKSEGVPNPWMNVAAGRADPFDAFPQVGRNIDHIIEYFLTSCPEEVPCSDDKYAWRPRNQELQLSKENSILCNMAEDYVSFVLWLYATTLIRDGIAGQFLSEEALHYYKLSLQSMQKAVSTMGGEYSDTFICALACFTACANFAGMFEAAEIHCDAMMKAISVKGKGDLVAGFVQYRPFTQKGIQWCEFGVAAQNRALPKVPYMPPAVIDDLPYSVSLETDRLTSVTLSSIPPVSDHFKNLFQMLHRLALSRANSSTYGLFPNKMKMDPAVIRPMYDSECIILHMLSSQQKAGHEYSKIDVMLTEACQLFFWIGPRGLPPEMKLCDRLVVWLKDALMPLLEDSTSPQVLSPPDSLQSDSQVDPAETLAPHLQRADSSVHIISSPRTLDNALLWGLYLGNIASSAHSRPENGWYQEQLRYRMQKLEIKSRDDLKQALNVFPNTAGFNWIDIRKLGMLFSG
ncbi:hypothetical protein P280DRAFT_138060 [Massarina eburnea CBS 473.64]|uniref:Uncharacterized protein n=1 Tax=Massarina eburnea CBS 473.64 TaxID=1395130 RepID=A0A6A6RR28_9PLEO|nr:hypothetical protein P280DRAFT_138060 [Massarina eburnea CBS 473.64]